MRKIIIFYLKDENTNEVKFNLNAELEYDKNNEFDEGELKFMHPFNGNMYSNPDACLLGWWEQNQEDEDNRWKLTDMIKNDEDIMQKVWDAETRKSGRCDEVEYATINYYL